MKDRQIKITNVFVNTSKFESTSVSPAFKQGLVSTLLNNNNSTAKHDIKNNVQSSSFSTFFIQEIITKGLRVSYKPINTIFIILAQKLDNCFKKCLLIVALLKSLLLEKLKQATTFSWFGILFSRPSLQFSAPI